MEEGRGDVEEGTGEVEGGELREAGRHGNCSCPWACALSDYRLVQEIVSICPFHICAVTCDLSSE